MANGIPFYDTYIQRRAQNEAEPVRQMGQLAQFATLQQHFAKLEQAKLEQERMAQFRAEMSTAKTPDEQRAVAARYAAPDAVLRMPQPSTPTAPAPSLTTVADPSRPGKNLRVDARTYKGGGIGSPGVLGEVLPEAPNDRSPYFTVQRTADGRLVWVNTRDPRETGLLTLPGEGKPLIAAQDDPQTRARVEGATVTAREEAKRTFNMSGIGGVIKRARDVLEGRDPDTGRKAPTPTQSGAGALVDKAAGFFGASPEGAAQAANLEAIGGALTAKMPRMEGPQGEQDLLLYKQMAAMVGDRTVPIPQRLEALRTVEALWRKYERLNPEEFTGGPSPQPGRPAQPPATPGLPSMDAIEAELRRRRGGK